MSYNITLEPFAVTFDCQQHETVLDAAFRAGIALRHGCKHGGCGACKVQVLDGEVAYAGHPTAISEADEEAGIALLCCAIPTDNLVVQLGDDYSEAELTPEFPVDSFNTVICGLTSLTRDIMHIQLALEDKDRPFRFRAGQYLEIKLPGTDQWRSFSMANAPDGGGPVELVVKLIPGGLFSGYLGEQARLGHKFEIRGPYGQFGASDTAAPMIMIAGGSGMAPLMSILRDLASSGSNRPIQFFYGARNRGDLFWLDEMAVLARQLPGFTFIPALSESQTGEEWQGETGLITDVVARNTPQSLRACEGYLCGPPGMIDAAIEVLRKKGMFASRIRFDKFLSTSGPSE